MALKILSGSAHRKFAEDICKLLKQDLCDARVSSFPDGETDVQIMENIRGADVYIVQPTCPPTNQNMMELLIMVDAARRASAERITAVIPYFGYARQDRQDQPRVPITARLVANLLVTSGVSRVLTMDLHAHQIQGFFDIPVDHLYACPVFVKYIRDQGLKDLVMISHESKNLNMVRTYAKALEADLAIAGTVHNDSAGVTRKIMGEIEGKNAIIIDDLVQAASTLSCRAIIALKNGAKSVRALIPHAFLFDCARENLKNSPVSELVCTDSTPEAFGPKVRCLSVAPIFAEAIRRIHNHESVTSILDIN